VPFWVELSLSPAVIAYAVVLAIVGAAIVGVALALKATGSFPADEFLEIVGVVRDFESRNRRRRSPPAPADWSHQGGGTAPTTWCHWSRH
jgi:hypothetical protein